MFVSQSTAALPVPSPSSLGQRASISYWMSRVATNPVFAPLLFVPFCSLKLLRHLPQSVYGVGAELARGDPDLTSYVNIGMVKPSELLGFVAVVSDVGCRTDER